MQMKTYTIKKRKHYSGIHFSPLWSPKGIEFEFMFTESSKYISEPNTYLREAWNKLAGISLDPFGRNSIRLAWRYNSDLDIFEVAAYYHDAGIFYVNEEKIIPFVAGQQGRCKIQTALYDLFDRTTSIESIITISELASKTEIKHDFIGLLPSIGYIQYPYFGGVQPAPHDVSLFVEFKNQ
jgi:hypothetical protein